VGRIRTALRLGLGSCEFDRRRIGRAEAFLFGGHLVASGSQVIDCERAIGTAESVAVCSAIGGAHHYLQYAQALWQVGRLHVLTRGEPGTSYRLDFSQIGIITLAKV